MKTLRKVLREEIRLRVEDRLFRLLFMRDDVQYIRELKRERS